MPRSQHIFRVIQSAVQKKLRALDEGFSLHLIKVWSTMQFPLTRIRLTFQNINIIHICNNLQ